MVTKPALKLYLKEHREAEGVSAEEMGKRLGIDEKSVYRQEREWWRVNPKKQAQWARALKKKPEAFWRPPGAYSLDAMAEDVPENMQQTARDMAADIIRRMVGQRRAG